MDNIKLSVKVADIDAKKSAYVVWRGFEESIKKAKEYGFEGIELGLRQKEDVDFIKLSGLLDKYDMNVSSISTGQVFSDLHLMLCDADDTRRKIAIKVMKGLIDIAMDYSGRINLSSVCGICKENVSREHAMAQLVESVSILTDYAEARDVIILIEPINRYESNMINTLAEAANLCCWIPADNLGIMPDLFHMNIEEERIGESLIAYGRYIKYMHFADSNRLAPGMGHLDYADVFDALQEIGYTGWISADILPIPTSDQAAYHAIQFLTKKMEKYRFTSMVNALSKEG